MARTIEVAQDRAFDDNKTVLPSEVARGVFIERAPSAQGLKLLLLLIGKASGRMADDVQHEIRLAELKHTGGIKNHSRASLRELFVELRGAVLVYEESETKDEIIGGFIDEVRVSGQHGDSGDLVVRWWFGQTFRRVAEQSNYWAIIDRQTAFALSSKFAILLFQHISSLVNLHHVSSKTFTVPELRAVLGVEAGKLSRFADLRRFALEPAISEITQLSRFTLTPKFEKVGRSVARVTITWEEKPDLKDTRHELDQPKVGRKARRDGNVEAVADSEGQGGFPASGGITFDAKWRKIKTDAGCNMDNTMIAEKFRSFCADKGISLDAKNIERTFAGFCKTVGRVG